MTQKSQDSNAIKTWIMTIWKWLKEHVVATLFCVAFILYVVCYIYQSGAVKRDALIQRYIALNIDSANLRIDLMYPEQLRADTTQMTPVVITLGYSTTVTTTQPYHVALNFSSSDVIAANVAGERINSRWTVTPTIQADAIISVNLRRALLSSKTESITPTLFIDNIYRADLPPIVLQSLQTAHANRFLDLVLGPTTPLIPAAAGLVAYAIKLLQEREKKREEEEKKRELAQKEREQVKLLLEQWSSLLKRDLSEGIRQYVNYRKKQGGLLGTHETGQQEVINIWKTQPELLRDAVAFLEIPEDPQPADPIKALLWVLRNLELSEEWHTKAYHKLLEIRKENPNTEGLEEASIRLFHDMLRPWPQFTFWRSAALNVAKQTTRELLDTIQGYAETDGLWFESVFPLLDWQKELENTAPILAVGPAGCGKTTAILQLLKRTTHRDSEDFYVYCPISQIASVNLLEPITNTIACTLLQYYAFHCTAFLKLDWPIQYALVQLWQQSNGRDLRSALYDIGLSPYGQGKRMLERIQTLADETSPTPIPAAHIPARLSEVCPSGFSQLTLLLDIQDPQMALPRREKGLLLELCKTLSRVGIGVKIFATENWLDLKPYAWREVKMIWTEADLTLLLIALKLKSRETDTDDCIDPWCNREHRGLQPEKRLLKAASGSPRRLLHCLQKLAMRREERGFSGLLDEDLNEILGVLPVNAIPVLEGTENG